jgi:tRNA U34 2-thiouridine synthase MnmA/TrmU
MLCFPRTISETLFAVITGRFEKAQCRAFASGASQKTAQKQNSQEVDSLYCNSKTKT